MVQFFINQFLVVNKELLQFNNMIWIEENALKWIINKPSDYELLKCFLSETQRKLIGLREMYGRLFERLKQEPENHYIYWPNRVQAINDFQEKVNNYIQENK